MSFRREMAAKRPITSRKNIVQNVAIIAAAGTNLQVITNAVEQMPGLANTQQVTVGSIVNTIYLEVWMYGNAVEGINSPVTWMLVKNPGNNLTFLGPELAGTDDNKRWIFAMGKGLLGSSLNGQPGYLIRGWFSIPRKMRRHGFDDEIQLIIKNDTANDINLCKLMIYKWYF